MTNRDYVLSSGTEGRDRLRILARVMAKDTTDLIKRAGVESGMSCLDVGCGGGDVSIQLARQVGSTGYVLGLDLDSVKLEIATNEAQAAGLSQLLYRLSNVFDITPDEKFDAIYSRFLLTHLADSGGAIDCMLGALKPGGVLILEDIDFSGHFCYPNFPAVWEYVRLYSAATQSTGGDANIGTRLPILLKNAGLLNIKMNVTQPAGLEGEAKLICTLTMESVGERVVELGLATTDKVKKLVNELERAAKNPEMVISAPRFVQAWGRKTR